MDRSGSVILVMGVSGSGKSTLGAALADRLDRPFVEADDFHPSVNIEWMRQGRPLDDAMRAPWLDAAADAALRAGTGVVLACSALKRSYRDRLRQRLGRLFVICLTGELHEIERRVASRTGHYMPASLVASQFQALELPGEDEDALVLFADRPLDELIDAAAAAVRSS